VHLDVLQRHAGRGRGGGERGLGVLRRGPDVHLAVLHDRGAAHGLHAGVREIGRVVLGLEGLRRRSEHLVEVAVLARDRDVLLRV